MEAESLFAEYRIRCELLGRTMDPAELLAEHPEHSKELRALFDAWRPSPGAPDKPNQELTSVGPYRILEVLGQGGMGTVYRAEQNEPIRRQVAVKVVKLGMDSQAILKRFEQERQALSVMNHDAIAKIFDAGITQSGQPYFAMECVEGIPLTQYCDERRLSVSDRIKVFQRVCQGVQHAHQKGIIHRDLKPGNILVAHHDGRHVPKIIDFGLARATERDLLEHTELTEHGVLLGTPEYMSPEQTFVDPSRIDTRTDVYSLGVVLYELLTGCLPFTSAELRRGDFSGIQECIRNKIPTRPSTKVSTLADTSTSDAFNRRSNVRQLQRMLRGELDWIVLRAMEKDRERRYGSATEFAEDLERYLGSEPVLAGPPSASYRLKRFLRRNRVAVTTGAVVFLALIAGLFATLWQARRAESNARSAETAAVAERRRADEVLRLSALQDYDELIEQVESLWPPHPAKIEACQRWLLRARGLVSELERHRAKRDELREMASPEVVEDQGKLGPGRQSWRFPETDSGREARWWHSNLTKLIDLLEGLQDEATGLLSERDDAVSPEHGWSVPRRIAFAERLRDGLAEGTDWTERWNEAIVAIRTHPDYGGLELRRQVGLVPIGPDPESGLWEFWHVATGAEPTRGEGGVLVPTAEMGVVLVLVPAGTFWMGAQAKDPNGRHYDPKAYEDEGPVHLVQLSAYFLSKYEMTQGQWSRFTGMNPSHYKPPSSSAPTLQHPVEQISWFDSLRELRRMGLDLPSEAQWENGCRAGSETPWHFGPDRESMRGRVNIADKNGKVEGWPACSEWPEHEDGHVYHCKVGAYPANEWGFHEVHGNLWEWCLDGFARYGPEKQIDPLVPWEGTEFRVYRGGSFNWGTDQARSTLRTNDLPRRASDSIGVRPAKLTTLD